MSPDNSPAFPTPTFADRIRGGVYGALVGDALGVPVEFKGRDDLARNPVAEMRSGGMWGQLAGTWSDDGAMLLCTAEASIGDFSAAHFGRLYVKWMRHAYWSARDDVFDIGGTTHRALSALADGLAIETVGEASEGSNGNGSLMRTLPLALRYAKQERESLIERAMAVSAITHAHPRAKLACALYCVIASELAKGVELGTALSTAAADLSPEWTRFPKERGWFARILDGSLFGLPRNELSSTGYVIDTLESSLWCVFQHKDFASAVLAAVNLGGDTDTTGCVTGGLAGVIYGYRAIPTEWIEALPKCSEIESLLQRFGAACGAE